MTVRTKGNVIIDEIKIGDIHWEFNYGVGFKSEVISKPTRNNEGYWSWESKCSNTGRIQSYGQAENACGYGLNLYDYEAYSSPGK